MPATEPVVPIGVERSDDPHPLPGRPSADAIGLEDRDGRAPPRHLTGDEQADQAGTDDDHVPTSAGRQHG
jgi:hypothetical protein